MHVPETLRRGWVFLILAAILPGCGSGSSAKVESTEQLSIMQVGQIFRLYQKGQKPPPKGVEDFLPMEQGYPAAIGSLKEKDVVVYWGAGLSDGSTASSTVLAYQKEVPEKGGEVLMQDGTARKMTAAEFQAAPKAGK